MRHRRLKGNNTVVLVSTTVVFVGSIIKFLKQFFETATHNYSYLFKFDTKLKSSYVMKYYTLKT